MFIFSRIRRKEPVQAYDVYTWPWGGWNYPEPILKDHEWRYSDIEPKYPPDDPYFRNLKYMADHGWYYYQKAFVEMQCIHPYANYKPVIHDEFRETFDAHFAERSMPLLIYERDGKLISSNDWDTYWLYREKEEPTVPCIILGHFNEQNPGIAVCDRPFLAERAEYLIEPRHPHTMW